MKNFSIRPFLSSLIISFLVISFLEGTSQVSVIDSLKQKLATTKSDTNRVNILNDLGLKLLDVNENARVLQYAKEALNLSIKLGYKKGTANAYLNASNAYKQQSNYPEALKNSAAALKTGEEIADGKIITAAYFSSGRIHTRWGNFGKALKNLELCLELSEEFKDNQKIADSYSAIGVVQENMGNFSEALKNQQMSLKIRISLGEKKRIAFSYNNLGIVYWDLGNYPEALKNYLEALKIQEGLGDKMRASDIYNNIGNLYVDMKKYPEGIKNHLASLKLRRELSDTNGISMTYNNIANAYFNMGKFAEALQSRQTALALQKKIGDKKNLGIDYNNIGQSFFNLRNYPEALKNYLESYKIRVEIHDQDGIAEVCSNLAGLYQAQQNYTEAKNKLDTTLTILKQIHKKAALEQTYLQYALLDSAMNNYKQAYLHQKLYALYHDSLFNEANTKKVVSAEMNFEFEKKEAISKAEQEKIVAIAAAESRKQKIIIIGVSILLLLILAFALFAYRNYRLKKQSNIRLEIQKKNIDDSIRYAQRIQQAILPVNLFHATEVNDYFIYYQPKDVVSGDFYWRHRIGDELFFAAVDCTGHGVPGAMMSMLGYDLLEYAVTDRGLREPADILNLMNRKIIQKLNSGNDKTATDGMDMTFCRLNLKTKELVFAGAKNDLYIYSKNELERLPVNKYSIGYEAKHVFTQNTIRLQSSDVLWLFTDGYCDQKGGTDGKKFMRSRWKNLLQKISPMPCLEQKKEIISAFETWKGMHSQRDDILVIGVRV
jgi:serine phosphatase RsbU (regulator of sigma subunit)